MTQRGRSNSARVGVWIAGAKGDIATTMIVGALGMRCDAVSTSGLTTALPPFNQLPLVALDQLVFGGLDINPAPLREMAARLYHESRTIDRELLDAVTAELDQIDQSITISRDMCWNPQGPTATDPPLTQLIAELGDALRQFRRQHELSHVVVVNLTSSEPEPAPHPAHGQLDELRQLIADNRKDLLTPSICYAFAALDNDCSYLNFTPNPGTELAAIEQLGQLRKCPYYGNDGKTGETLVKTALAPMFAWRNLRVLSWEGVNMLGNNDGRELDKPTNRVAKLRNKGDVLEGILGYQPHSGIDINYVPSLGDWKTAWDLIHFQGFLDVKMSMQFTWQGCDSILAAPLVLDMVRFSEFAARSGESGPMHHLAAFFKHPIGVDQMALHEQFGRLLNYAEQHLSRRPTGGVGSVGNG